MTSAELIPRLRDIQAATPQISEAASEVVKREIVFQLQAVEDALTFPGRMGDPTVKALHLEQFLEWMAKNGHASVALDVASEYAGIERNYGASVQHAA